MAQQANAQGITVLASSGDSRRGGVRPAGNGHGDAGQDGALSDGAAGDHFRGRDAVRRRDAAIIGARATRRMAGRRLSYIPEAAWNETSIADRSVLGRRRREPAPRAAGLADGPGVQPGGMRQYPGCLVHGGAARRLPHRVQRRAAGGGRHVGFDAGDGGAGRAVESESGIEGIPEPAGAGQYQPAALPVGAGRARGVPRHDRGRQHRAVRAGDARLPDGHDRGPRGGGVRHGDGARLARRGCARQELESGVEAGVGKPGSRAPRASR